MRSRSGFQTEMFCNIVPGGGDGDGPSGRCARPPDPAPAAGRPPKLITPRVNHARTAVINLFVIRYSLFVITIGLRAIAKSRRCPRPIAGAPDASVTEIDTRKYTYIRIILQYRQLQTIFVGVPAVRLCTLIYYNSVGV